jgi:ABC-type uncharacterized transport system substrate-binding protein
MTTRRNVVAGTAAAMASPWVVEAQQAPAKVAFIVFSHLPLYEASFDSRLRGLGWDEGRNLRIERHYIRTGQALAELAVVTIKRAPDVIVVPSAGIATAFRLETRTVPIVVIAAGELVAAGLADSLARPGGNVTGTQIVQRDLMANGFNCSRRPFRR